MNDLCYDIKINILEFIPSLGTFLSLRTTCVDWHIIIYNCPNIIGLIKHNVNLRKCIWKKDPRIFEFFIKLGLFENRDPPYCKYGDFYGSSKLKSDLNTHVAGSESILARAIHRTCKYKMTPEICYQFLKIGLENGVNPNFCSPIYILDFNCRLGYCVESKWYSLGTFVNKNPSYLKPLVDIGYMIRYNDIKTITQSFQPTFLENCAIDPSSLLTALLVNDRNIAKKLIRKNTVNFSNREGLTPLLWAVRKGWIDWVELMINTGANIYHKDKKGCGVIFYAKAKQYHKKNDNWSEVLNLLKNGGMDYLRWII